jgi:DNA polymerase-3 subunit beta
MRFIVSSTTLLKSLQAISGVLNSNNTLPILDDFLFKAVGDDLIITASDLETTMSVSVTPEMLEDAGMITIPAKILLDTLKTYHDIPLTFIINEDLSTVEISSESGKFKLAGHHGEEYPQTPLLDDPMTLSLKSEVLYSAITKTIFAAGNDELRPVMSGVFFQLSPEDATFVATDAHNLVRYRRADAASEESLSFIMPKKPLNQLKSNLSNDDSDVRIDYNVTNARFSFNNLVMVCRLIEGKYPNYDAVIPRDNPNVLTIAKAPLIAAIKRVAIYGNQSTHQIRFKMIGQMLTLTAEDVDYSNEGAEVLTCTYDGDDMEIGFNSKFLLEMLNNADTENIMIEMSAPNRAGLITQVDPENVNENMLMLVMPVMLN